MSRRFHVPANQLALRFPCAAPVEGVGDAYAVVSLQDDVALRHAQVAVSEDGGKGHRAARRALGVVLARPWQWDKMTASSRPFLTYDNLRGLGHCSTTRSMGCIGPGLRTLRGRALRALLADATTCGARALRRLLGRWGIGTVSKSQDRIPEQPRSRVDSASVGS